MESLENEIGELLRQRGLTLAVVESATGGLISHRITSIPGSSDYFKGGITSYSNEAKINLVGVKAETLQKYGAVSYQVAEEMAAGGRKALHADICIADTGIAGPGGATADKPVGLFYLALAHASGTFSRKHIFDGDRAKNKQSAAGAALEWLKESLSSISPGGAEHILLEEKRVVTCFLESNGEILILRRSDRVGTYQGLWAGVSGYIEKDKTADEQAMAEVQEETGLDPADLKLISQTEPLVVEDEKLGIRWIVHPYLFQISDEHRIKLDWEHKESRWIKPGEMPDYETVPMLAETLQKVLSEGKKQGHL